MQVTPQGVVRLIAPHRVSQEELLEMVQLKQAWIYKRLFEFQQSDLTPAFSLSSGEKYLLLGEWKTIRVVPTSTQRTFFSLYQNQILLHKPMSAGNGAVADVNQAHIQKQFCNYLRAFSIAHIERRLEECCQTSGLRPEKVKFHFTKSRWGSCTSRKVVNLNWLLGFAPIFVIDSVVLHELCHLVHLNHSPRFWDLLSSHSPHHLEADKWLKSKSHYLFGSHQKIKQILETGPRSSRDSTFSSLQLTDLGV